MTRPLDGIRVVDLSTFVFAPAAAAILADWGADVIKVEHPLGGDPGRTVSTWGVPAVVDGVGCIFEFNNRGKRSVAIDIANAEARDVFMRLIDTADVFLTNFLPATRRKLGIDVDDLMGRNPALIYARASGQGALGPGAELGGFDAMTYWGRSGAAIAVSPPDHRYPLAMPGPGFGDVQAGMALAGGVGTALFHREKTGKGAVVDVSLLGAGMWAMGPTLMAASLTGLSTLDHQGHLSAQNPLVNTYRTSDGEFIALVFVQSDRYWPEFCLTVGREEWLADERFGDLSGRLEHNEALIGMLDELFAEHTCDEWCAILARQEGQWDVVNSPGRALVDPDALANGYAGQVEHEGGRPFTCVNAPVQFDLEAPATTRAPTLGRHTDEILGQLGLASEEVTGLRARGAVS